MNLNVGLSGDIYKELKGGKKMSEEEAIEEVEDNPIDEEDSDEE